MRSPDEITAEELAEATTPREPVEVATPVDERYPRSLARRPVLLPAGISSISLTGEIAHFAQPNISAVSAGLFVGGAIGFSSTELSAGVSVTPFASQDAPTDQELVFPTMRAVSAGIRQRVGHETALGAELTITFPGSDYQGFAPDVTLVHKVHLSDRAAILLGGGFELVRAVTTREFGGFIDYDRAGGFANVIVEANVSENVCILAATTAEQFFYLDDVMPGSDYRQYLTRLGVLVATSDAVDVSVGWNISSTGGRDAKSLSFTLTARRMP